MKPPFKYPSPEQLSWRVSTELVPTYFDPDIEYLNINFTTETRIETVTDKAGNSFVVIKDVPELGIGLFNTSIEIVVNELDGNSVGEYNHENRSITLIPTIQSAEDLLTILLHEIIHAFEHTFCSEQPNQKSALKELLLIHYYNQAVTKFGQKTVQRWINHDQHVSNQHYDDTAWHSPFFMLKSILLDDQLSLPLGTIYGYEKKFKPGLTDSITLAFKKISCLFRF